MTSTESRIATTGDQRPPTPHYDVELGKICAWLKANGYTMHVTLNGSVSLRKKIAR